MLPVTSIAAAVLAALLLLIARRTIGARRAAKVAVGDGGNDPLARLMRVQGNFCEYAPVFLILTALAELNRAPWWWLAPLAAAFVAGRLSHAYGLTVAECEEGAGPRRFRFRIAGMAATFTTIWLLIATVPVVLLLPLFGVSLDG